LPEQSIANLSGDQLIQYLNTLSQRQSEYSKIKIKLTEDLVPIDQARALKKAEIQMITENHRPSLLLKDLLAGELPL
jgi:hypothetical protein